MVMDMIITQWLMLQKEKKKYVIGRKNMYKEKEKIFLNNVLKCIYKIYRIIKEFNDVEIDIKMLKK